MLSAGTRGVTIVTILTLIFATIVGRDESERTELVGTTVETHVERCAPGAPCPAHRFELRVITLPRGFGLPARAPAACKGPAIAAPGTAARADGCR